MRIDSLHVLPSPRLILRSCAESLTLILSSQLGDDRALPPSAPLLSRSSPFPQGDDRALSP